MPTHKETLEAHTNRLATEGRLIEAGWTALCLTRLLPNTPPEQVRDLRWAYMAGAQHVFSSMMTMMDPCEEVTDADIAKMEALAAELNAFAHEMRQHLPTEGNA